MELVEPSSAFVLSPCSSAHDAWCAVVVKRARHSKDDPITEAESKAPECIPMDETTSEAAASGMVDIST